MTSLMTSLRFRLICRLCGLGSRHGRGEPTLHASAHHGATPPSSPQVSASDSDTDGRAGAAGGSHREGAGGRAVGGGGRDGGSGRGWQMESLMAEDQHAMRVMERMLEGLRSEPPPTDRPAAQMGARYFFLHPREIMNVTRTGADRQVSSVL